MFFLNFYFFIFCSFLVQHNSVLAGLRIAEASMCLICIVGLPVVYLKIANRDSLISFLYLSSAEMRKVMSYSITSHIFYFYLNFISI